MSGEHIVDLGGERFGILSGASGDRASGVCLILFNAGFIHRSGPFRLHARLSRQLAAAGHAAFRFDAPGIGDSIARSDQPLLQTMLASMDVLEHTFGYSRFVVGGLCSAADLGWQVAIADPRVVGLLSIDGLARQGTWYRIARLQRALRKSPREWANTLFRHARAAAQVHIADDSLRDWPAPGTERGQFAALMQRRVELFSLFTGGASYFLHARQFEETYGRAVNAASVAFHHWPQCDHTFFAESDRRALIRVLADWMDHRFGRYHERADPSGPGVG